LLSEANVGCGCLHFFGANSAPKMFADAFQDNIPQSVTLYRGSSLSLNGAGFAL
jgi:hypothetical protein